MCKIRINEEADKEITNHMRTRLSFIEGLLLIGVGLIELSKYFH